ncbi:hypothetical protein N7516_002135 [Penicillium verrucosum]|uniref:uncharacterized protein n=1 Tax=Penicillium verrucosum TaxID=60171 RepID=UPI0025451D42|nr:uncharacterized protein N7516_002135 [Penicillium verrucosum]KAJ5941967.1 hypothetical protein N7516_002135 [Penicillium verrucosum]
MKNKLRSTAGGGGGGGIKQNNLRQGFCLLSFNFNLFIFFKPRVFRLLSTTPFISVLLSKINSSFDTLWASTQHSTTI